jgi:hypothetical protein
MYELLADTLGQRSMEIDLILDNLV